MKYYAVKRGTVTGIFTDWETCRTAVEGFPGAEYKSFKTKKEAESYLSGDVVPAEPSKPQIDLPENTVAAYTDGSYDVKTGRYAFGCVIIPPNGETVRECGVGTNPEAAVSRNVAGELMAVMFAVRWAAKNGYRKIAIFHDYEGVSAWYQKRWKATSLCAVEYLKYMEKYRPHMEISFYKVTAHTGVELNEEADKLAKSALGI